MFPELEKALRKHFAPYQNSDENTQLFTSILIDLTENTKEKITNGVPEKQALAEAIASLNDLDDLLKTIQTQSSGTSIDSKQLTRFYDRFFATKLVNSLTVDVAQLNQIILNYHTATIIVTETQQKTLIINEYMNHDRPSLYAQQHLDGDKVKIEQSARGGAFAFMRIRVEIAIPKSFTGFIYLNDKSGSMLLNDLTSHYILDCSTDNGSIIAHNLDLAQIHIQAKSGSVKTAFLTAEQIVLRSTSGSIQLIHSHGTTVNSMVSTKTRSGDILLEHLEASEINAENRSGNITLNFANADTFNLLDHSGRVAGTELSGSGRFQSTSGTVTLRFKQVNRDISAISKSGSIRIGLPFDSEYSFKANTTNGNVFLPYDTQYNAGSNRRQKSGQHGNKPSFNLTSKTVSGNIQIN
ncbi:DUF4097 family beta strand repeat-containing protein [Lapidilactobacillus bayanensis]|uniref:DUF4097 family beta strand repeat-containing protein n=1 Tax=Lapidilactobacillus bayanensis TaxID=2485998 RepID=UPI000F791F90|nr:DUF4097 family beta strand repeat-containing protein [Lapidilactobacillus bayanensis]